MRPRACGCVQGGREQGAGLRGVEVVQEEMRRHAPLKGTRQQARKVFCLLQLTPPVVAPLLLLHHRMAQSSLR